MFKQLWNDDAGVVTVEYLVLGTFLALALIVGVSALATHINSELSELGNAISTFDQSYEASGYTCCSAKKKGSAANDEYERTRIRLSDPRDNPIQNQICE